MSKKYSVSLPVAGIMNFEVDADSRREAIDACVDKARELIAEVASNDSESLRGYFAALEALEPYERLVEGNVIQVELDEVIVQDEDGFEVDEGDEEEAEGLDDDSDEGDGDEDGDDES